VGVDERPLDQLVVKPLMTLVASGPWYQQQTHASGKYGWKGCLITWLAAHRQFAAFKPACMIMYDCKAGERALLIVAVQVRPGPSLGVCQSLTTNAGWQQALAG
jgi:hypothetical protein